MNMFVFATVMCTCNVHCTHCFLPPPPPNIFWVVVRLNTTTTKIHNSPNNGESVIKLLVGNKIDLDRQVERDRADAWARSHGMLFLEASAKTRLGIRQVFMEVVQKILDNPDALASAVPGKPKLQIKRPVQPSSNDDEDDSGGCC
jgi:GTPase SAR1 family protein